MDYKIANEKIWYVANTDGHYSCHDVDYFTAKDVYENRIKDEPDVEWFIGYIGEE